MKHLSILGGVCAVLFSCNDGSQQSAKTDSSVNLSLRDSLTVFDTAVISTTDTVTLIDTGAVRDQKIHTKFRFYYTTSYCGGARPTEEIIRQNEMPRKLTGSTARLKNHHSGIEYNCKIGSDGEATVDLEEGKYDVYLTKEINPELSTGFDPNCSLWMNKSLFTVKVTDDGKVRDVTLHFECNPCDENIKRRP